ncbi:hypothetical protein Fmac_013290 [Flemingia macrophylla]|uniref:Protein TIFY n=1 Tax=Flemingia macrophylla TaxID=520843 RepID=A0ABD1MSS6_9FABA
MAGVHPEVGGSRPYLPVMENSSDDGPLMHFSAPWPVASSGQNSVTPSPTQLTILYKGNMCIYDGIPAGKVREIMLIASSSAKSAEIKSGIPLTSLIPTTTNPSSPQGNSTNLASSQFPAKKSSICRLQEFPLARRQSLQRFLEKRRKRLGSRGPYTSPVSNIDHNFCSDKTIDFGLNYEREDFSPVLLPL